MNLYAETSAVLSWLLGEPNGEAVRGALMSAGEVVVSELTLLECHRAFVRGIATNRFPEAVGADRAAALTRVAQGWHVLSITAPILERAARPFPVEPIRTLDALHLASALSARSALAGLAVLSLDHRVSDNARSLGFHVLPAHG